MSRHAAAGERPALLNALLGVALLAAAGLDILLLAEIGGAAWQRATLAERWQNERLASHTGQPQALANMATGADQILAILPSDADIDSLLAGIPARAAAWGVTVTQITPQPPEATPPSQRSFLLRAEGAEGDLMSFLVAFAEPAPTGAHIDNVELQFAGSPSTLEITLTFTTRQATP